MTSGRPSGEGLGFLARLGIAQQMGPREWRLRGSAGTRGCLGVRGDGNLRLERAINKRSLKTFMACGPGSPREDSDSRILHSRGSGPGGRAGGRAALSSGQENIWRPDSRPGAKFSKYPLVVPSSSLEPALSFSLLPTWGKIKAGISLAAALFLTVV